jgi:hypothetical protein
LPPAVHNKEEEAQGMVDLAAEIPQPTLILWQHAKTRQQAKAPSGEPNTTNYREAPCSFPFSSPAGGADGSGPGSGRAATPFLDSQRWRFRVDVFLSVAEIPPRLKSLPQHFVCGRDFCHRQNAMAMIFQGSSVRGNDYLYFILAGKIFFKKEYN